MLPDKSVQIPHDTLSHKEGDSEVMQCIKELLRERVRPMVQSDGGDLQLRGFDDASGTLEVSLLGACKSCPSSDNTLQDGIARLVQHFVPEVRRVVQTVPDTSSVCGCSKGDAQEPAIVDEESFFADQRRRDKKRVEMVHRRVHPKLMSFDELNEPEA